MEAKCIVHQSLLLLALMKGLFLTQKMPRASRQLRKSRTKFERGKSKQNPALDMMVHFYEMC